jgi:hypothetical protein
MTSSASFRLQDPIVQQLLSRHFADLLLASWSNGTAGSARDEGREPRQDGSLLSLLSANDRASIKRRSDPGSNFESDVRHHLTFFREP